MALACCLGLATAALGADATVPLPPPEPPARPPELASPTVTPLPPPLPPKRPDDVPGAPATADKVGPEPAASPSADTPPPLPPARPPELTGEAALALKVAPPDDTACLRRLERLGVAYEKLPPVSNGQCGAPNPLKVTRLGDGVELKPAATLVCPAVEALARWTTEVHAASETLFGEGLSSLSLGGSYECRGQNHDTDAKLSEHAFANGVDIMAYAFAKRAPIEVVALPEGTPEAAFQAEARAKACRFFRTVLGPGSNAAHANHLHLDERERPAGHRLCE